MQLTYTNKKIYTNNEYQQFITANTNMVARHTIKREAKLSLG